jgi:hypothetical protein
MGDELRELAVVLTETIDHVIGSREKSEFALESFESALKNIRDVRHALDGYADELSPKTGPSGVGIPFGEGEAAE